MDKETHFLYVDNIVGQEFAERFINTNFYYESDAMEFLMEIPDIKDYFKKTFKIDKAEYKSNGGFSEVFVFDDYCLKVFLYDDLAYYDYLNFSRKYSDLIYTPKIFEIEKLFIEDRDNSMLLSLLYIVKMERLYPIEFCSDIEKEIFVEIMLDLETELKQNMEVCKNIKNDNSLLDMIRFLNLVKHEINNIEFDLKTDNLMKRENGEYVFIDPITPKRS